MCTQHRLVSHELDSAHNPWTTCPGVIRASSLRWYQHYPYTGSSAVLAIPPLHPGLLLRITVCQWQQNDPAAYFDHTRAPGREGLWGGSSSSSSSRLPCPLSLAFQILLWKTRSAAAFWKAKSWGLVSQISRLTRPFFSSFTSHGGKSITPTRSSLLSFSNNIWILFAPLWSFEAALLKHVVWSSLFFCER